MLKTKIKAIMSHYAPSKDEYLPNDRNDYLMIVTYSSYPYPTTFFRQSLKRERGLTIVTETYKDYDGYYYKREFLTGGDFVVHPVTIVEFLFDGKQFLAKYADGRIIPIRSIPQKTRQFKKSY